jgi:hypothetical protein
MNDQKINAKFTKIYLMNKDILSLQETSAKTWQAKYIPKFTNTILLKFLQNSTINHENN